MTRSEFINDKYGFDTANETQAICESATNDKILEFKRLDKFTDKFIEMKNNGEVWGVYYNKNGNLVAQLIGGGVIKNILYEE